MKIPYYPGCTLHNKARGLDNSTRYSLAALGVELTELSRWTCCGTTFPLARDNYMGMVASARILAGVAREGGSQLVTTCSFCFNVLKRVNHALKHNPEARQRLNNYMEEDYAGEVALVHPLEICKNHVGFNVIGDRAANRLRGLKVACYYGCMLVRPGSEIDLGGRENPLIMEELAGALGAEAVQFPAKTACCGSYQVLHESALVVEKAREIISAATARGAEAIITSCPLCQFNLDRMQEKAGLTGVPVLYFSQLLGAALGLPMEGFGLEDHRIDPRPLLSGTM